MYYCVIVAFSQHVLNEHDVLCYDIWIDIVDIGLLTINIYRVSSVNFVDIIVFAIVCIVVVVSICEILCVVLLVTLLWTMYWYMHWCVEFENENAFQI